MTVAHVLLPEERTWNRVSAARLKRRKDLHEVWKAAEIGKRNRNDARVKWRRAGDEDVSSDDDREHPPGSSDEDGDNEETVVDTVRLVGEMTEGFLSSTSGALLRSSAAGEAA